MEIEDAAKLAETLLAEELPRRWRHVRSVARRARWVALNLSLPDDLVTAAWLHDIGYASELVATGFHPLDGARYLKRLGVNGQVVSLVAYHSCAQIEAEVRGLGTELASDFSPAESLLSDGCQARVPGRHRGSGTCPTSPELSPRLAVAPLDCVLVPLRSPR